MTFQDAKLKAAKLWESDQNRYGLTFMHRGETFVYRGCTYEPRLEDWGAGINPEALGWDVRFTTEEEYWHELKILSAALNENTCMSSALPSQLGACDSFRF